MNYLCFVFFFLNKNEIKYRSLFVLPFIIHLFSSILFFFCFVRHSPGEVFSLFWLRDSSCYMLLLFGLDRGNDNQQMCNVRHSMEQIGSNSGQILIGKVTWGKDVHHIGSLLTSRSSNIHYSSRLLLLQVRDKARLQIGGLLQHVHMITTTRQCQKHTVLIVRLR